MTITDAELDEIEREIYSNQKSIAGGFKGDLDRAILTEYNLKSLRLVAEIRRLRGLK